MTTHALVMLACASMAAGCGVPRRAGPPTAVASDAITVGGERALSCARATHGAGAPFREPLPGAVEDPELLSYLAGFSPDVRRTAVAAGVEPLLARLVRERTRTGGDPTPELLEMRAELDERVGALPGQLLATELECECVRASLVRALAEHEERERSRELNLTIATLVAGAGFGLAAGIWDLANAHTASPDVPDGPAVTAIAGAAVTSALGAAILVPREHELVFVHEHDLLPPIARGEDPEGLFPTFVLRMLTTPDEEGRTPREALLSRWADAWDEAIPIDQRPLAEAIVYGGGGVYDATLLALHARLLEELEATLDSLSHHVDALHRAIAAALEEELTRSD